jgi:molecular chaperone DnaK
VREVATLLPRVRELTQGTPFGSDALTKAVRWLEQAQAALDGGQLSTMVEAQEQLGRTLNLFRGVIQRIGNGR